MTDQKLIRVGASDPDPVDLNDETRYYHASADSRSPTPIYERETRALRGQDAEQLVRNHVIASETTIRVYCVGADIQEALENESRIIEHLSKASKHSLPSREGSAVELVQGIRTQFDSQVWTIEYGEWRPVMEELKAADIIAGDLYLRLSPIPVATTPTLKVSPIMCNFDTWTVDVLGTEPVTVKLSVEMLGAAAHYDRIRVADLTEETVNPANHLYPFHLGDVVVPPVGYTVSLGAAGRLSGATMTVVAKGLGQYQLIYRSAAGDVYSVGGVTNLTDGAAYHAVTHVISTDPATDLAFAVADFNAGQWGVRKLGSTEVRITQMILAPYYVVQETLLPQATDLLPTGTGASDAWAKTGAGSAFDAVNDPVGADDGDATRISSSTDGQETLLTYPAYTGLTGVDTGVSGWVVGPGGFTNGGLEAPYSGPTFGATIVNDPLASTAGWVPKPGLPVNFGYNGGLSAIQVQGTPGQTVWGFAIKDTGYGGLAPGRTVRFQCDMRTLYTVPEGQGAMLFLQDGSDRGYFLRQNTSVFTTEYVDFVPFSGVLSVYLMAEGPTTPCLFKNIMVREVESVAEGWTQTGTMHGFEETNTGSFLSFGVPSNYVYDGESAQGVAAGDASNAVEQTYSVIDGESYKVVARIRAHGASQSFGGQVSGMNLRVVSGASEAVQTTFNTSSYDRVESVIVADGDSMTIQAYANADGAGYLDGVFVQRINAPEDTGAVAFQITIDQDVTDHYGTHQIWARCKVTAPVAVQVRYGGDDGMLAGFGPVVIEPSTNVRIVRLGTVVIPATPTAPDAPIESFTFSVIITPAGASDEPARISFDAIELFPARQFIIAKSAADKGPGTNERQVFDGGSQTVYVGNASGSTLRTTASREGQFIRLYPGANRFFPRVSRTEEDDRLCPEDTFRLRLQYTAAGLVKSVFDPMDLITQYDYWYRAYDLAGVDGANLDTWPDLSGNGRNAVWPGSGAHALIHDAGLGALRIVRMNAARLNFAEIALPEAQIFMIAKLTTPSVFQGTMLRTSATPGPNYGIGVQESGGNYRLYGHMYSDHNNGAQKYEQNANHVLGAWHLYQLEADYAGLTLAMAIDGSPITLQANTTNLTGSSGIEPDGGSVTMDVGQIIVAHGLTTDEIDDLVSYLMAEAGL